MEERMKNDNRKIVRWITVNGNHVPLFEGQTEEDAVKNLKDYLDKNSKKKTYKDMLAESNGPDAIYEVTGQFAADTQIGVSEGVLEEIDDESLVQVYDTIRELKERSRVCVDFIELYNEDTIENCDPNAFAAMAPSGKLYLNSIYFSQRPDDITELFQESVDFGFHPKCPDGIAGIITHEVGHANFFAWMEGYNMGKGGSDKDFDNAYEWCGSGTMTDTKGKLFGEIFTRYNNVSDRIRNNEQVKKEWGRTPNMSLEALATPKWGTPSTRISEYAGKNVFELLAEAYADVMWNENSASLLSKEIYNEFYKQFEKK
jgi:hypothetical protein